MLRPLAELGDQDPKEAFEALFRSFPDGIVRKYPPAHKGDRVTTAYIDESLAIDADVRRRMVVFEALVGMLGPVGEHLFPNLYIFSEADNMEAQYWPERGARRLTARAPTPLPPPRQGGRPWVGGGLP
jgi:hypothetical protein